MKAELKKLEIHKSTIKKPNCLIYVLGCDSNCLEDEGKYVYAIEFVWPSNDKSCNCSSLKPIHKDRREKLLLKEYLMSYIRMDTSRYHIPYRRFRN